MIVSYEVNSAPVVYLSANVADEEMQDSVVVDGQEELSAEAESVDATEEEAGTEEVAVDAKEEEAGTEEVAVDAKEEETGTEDSAVGEETQENAEAVDSEETSAETEGADQNAQPQDEAMDVGADTGSGELEGTVEVKDPLLSSPVAVGGISLAVIAVGCVLGFFLAKRKIKKGIEVYEDF